MKKILFTLVALCVTLSSWGYAKGEVVYNYDPVTNTYDESMVYMIESNNESNLTCKLVSTTRTDEHLVVPGEIFTDQNKKIKVFAFGYNANHPTMMTTATKVLELSENITTLDSSVFSYGTSIEKLILPSSFTHVSKGNVNAPNLKEIEIDSPNCSLYVSNQNSYVLVKNANKSVMLACVLNTDGEYITELTIPEGVETADVQLFAGAATYKKIEKINLPSTFIDFKFSTTNNAFNGLLYLKEYTVSTDNPKYCAYDGILYEKPFAVVDGDTKPWGTKLVAVPRAKYTSNDVLEVKEGVTELLSSSIGSSQAKEIILPEGLTTLNADCIASCNQLTTITIPTTLTDIPDGAFRGNTRLSAYIVRPGNPVYASLDGVLYTNDYKTLLSCPAAKTGDYTIHADTEKIADSAFINSKLSSVDLTAAQNLYYLGTNSFLLMTNITHVYIPASIKQIGNGCFTSCSKLTSVTFEHTDDPENSLEFGAGAFFNDNIDELVFPSHLTTMTGSLAGRMKKVSFEEGSRLTTYAPISSNGQLPDIEEIDLSNCSQLTTIPNNCFQNSSTLKTVKLPASITTLGSQSFFNTPNLEEIVFAEGTQIKTIGNNVFQDCGVRNLTIPDQVVSIGKEAFVRCPNLTTVKIPASTRSIDVQAFKYCDNLTKFVVDKDNTKYSATDGMLASKDKKTLLLFPPGKSSVAGTMLSPSFEKIGEYACYACTRLTSIIIPKKVKTIGNHAFEFCENLNSITFLGDVPPVDLDADVTADNAKADYNQQDHRFGYAGTTAREFLHNNVTINLRKNDNEDMYKAENSYWNDCLAYTYSFSAQNGKNEDGGKNQYDYLATSLTSVAVLGSTSENYTAVVPEKVVNPDNKKEYTVAIIGDYAFENISDKVKEIVFLGPIELIGANAFNNGHLGTYKPEPTSTIENIFFANTEAVGQNELSTKRFDLGTEFGTEEYPEFTKTQKIYVAKSKLAGYKENMPKFADQIDYKIPDAQITTKYGTFSREFDTDFSDCYNEDGDQILAFTGLLIGIKPGNGDYGQAEAHIRMESIYCGDAEKDGVYVPANTGVLLKCMNAEKTTNAYYCIGEKKARDYNNSANVMNGVTENPQKVTEETGSAIYVMSSGLFHYVDPKYYSTLTMPVHKAYLKLADVPANAKIVFEDGDAAGIEDVEAVMPEVSETIYNLQGQRVNGNAKGIVIKNGKKIFVK